MSRTLLCQDAPYQREADVVVTACEAVEGGFDVGTPDSVLYPEGGGQPCDHGAIGGVAVRDVRRDGAIVWHRASSAVPLGVHRAVVDWERRYDHMQQHTTQHLLSALALAEFDLPTTTFHLAQWDRAGAPPPCTIELAAPELPQERLDALAARVNDEIRAARTIRIRSLERDQLEAHGVRSRLLPAGLEGPIRLIEIDGLDLNTCGGTHLGNTAEAQGLVFVGLERARGRVRVSWLSGARLLRASASWSSREKLLSARLTRGADQHVAAVEQLQEAARRAEREVSAAREALGATIGRALQGSGFPLVFAAGAADAALLRSIATAALDGHDGGLVLVADDGLFLVAGPAPWVAARAPAVSAALGGRGGGRGERFQGSGADPTRLDAARAALRLS
jgi:Ser-tRNA(Ala) deacylase AlaX